jgi:hypothetical protein
MSFFFQTKTAPDALAARSITALRVVVAFSLAAACVMALAEVEGAPPAASPSRAQDRGEVDIAALERAFWACDRAATAYGLAGSDGMACSTATELFQQRRFNGDFAALLAWWHEHKAAAHQALAQDEEGEQSAHAELPLP